MYYENFERLCNEKNVKPADVARATNISTSTLTCWKQGKYTPKADKLARMASYFECSVSALMGTEAARDVCSVTYSDSALDQLDRMLTLTEEQQNMVIELINVFDYDNKNGNLTKENSWYDFLKMFNQYIINKYTIKF